MGKPAATARPCLRSLSHSFTLDCANVDAVPIDRRRMGRVGARGVFYSLEPRGFSDWL
jgi:hypothetical protein